MKRLNLIFILCITAISGNAFSKEHYNKQVEQVQIEASNGCILFTLKGVSEADPVIPNSPWFSMHPDNPSKQSVLSVLLLSYTTGAPLKVKTTGNGQCGHSEFTTVRLQPKS